MSMPAGMRQLAAEVHGLEHPHPLYLAQVKRFSVKRIVSPLIFDNLKNPVPEGLYDPAFGPVDARAW